MAEIKRTTVEALYAEAEANGSGSASISQPFIASQGPCVPTKIILTNKPTGEWRDGFGTRVLNIDIKTENLEQVLMEQITKLMHDFVQGKASLKTFSSGNFSFAALSDVLVDCEPNEMEFDSWFNVLNMYTPITFLENLAKEISTTYGIDVEIIDGKEGGLVLRRDKL